MKSEFTKQKRAMLDKLTEWSHTIQQVTELVDLEFPEVTAKLATSRQQIEEGRLIIAVFGAFSDGKTSVLSALTHRLDLKIDPKPTTDKIEVYNYGDLRIIDTPGLYSGINKHDKQTRDYISEAHLVLYVVDAVNPLKDSHRETVRWILNDLQKASASVFLINKMDAVCNIEDPEDFHESALIKRQVVLDAVRQYTPEVTQDIEIVCIAANPHGKGFKEWMTQEERYKTLSHITELEAVIHERAKESADALVENGGFSVILDASERVRTALKDLLSLKRQEKVIADALFKEVDHEVREVNRSVRAAHDAIQTELHNLREELVDLITAAPDQSALGRVSVVKIGRDGAPLQRRVEAIIERNTMDSDRAVEVGAERIVSAIDDYAAFEAKVTKFALENVKTVAGRLSGLGDKTLRPFVFKSRDVLQNILGKKILFKTGRTGGAKVLAGKLSTLLKGLPLIFEGIDMLLEAYAEKKFKEAKKRLVNSIEDFFNGVGDAYQLEKFKEVLYPAVSELSKSLDEVKERQSELNSMTSSIDKAMRLVDTGLIWADNSFEANPVDRKG